MDVYLVRHAIAHDRDPEQVSRTTRCARSQTRASRSSAAPRAGWAGSCPSVEVVLASPHTRAWDTAVLLNEEVGWPEPEPSAR